MATFKTSANKQLVRVRHRAICEEGDFKGPWRDDPDTAAGDALNHQEKKPGHVVKVLSEETSSFDIVTD